MFFFSVKKKYIYIYSFSNRSKVILYLNDFIQEAILGLWTSSMIDNHKSYDDIEY